MSTAAHIEALLKARIGLDAGAIGSGAVARAVRERQQARQAPDPESYWQLLQGTADEFQALIEAVVVPETWFFRHREALLALGRFAAERAFADGRRTLRLLSLPCSTGEEPYSIAMALLDAGVPPGRFYIDAVDISARALARAHQAHYNANAFRSGPLDFRDRYFTATPTGYVLDPRVRGQVRLLQGNLVEPGLLAGEAPYDFVFCRNLLIYFDAAGQRQAVQTLVRLTMADGLLFVGPAEASVLSAQGLEPVGIPLSFAFRKPAAAAPRARPPSHPPVHATQPPRMAAPPRLPRPPTTMRAPAVRAPAPAAAPTAAPTAAPAAKPAAGTHAAALADIAAMADRGELDAATAACLALLDRAAPDADGTALADAYGMLGVLHDAAGRTAQAHAAYRKALYLDPSHQESLYHLAALLDTEGDHGGATRLRQRAQRHTRKHHG
ncbi:CheR family methyltransferase [Cupriavidus neocaledonicus]|uniref:Chemotaxis receptor methyltransferase n=1 Tax=Cupriavidus neocaledonicus TaxID=1040979 RepID=A0A375HPS3_9BURK|nr:CheR family methyltransferase [Cupriavidus neocaledonicus]SOZ39003.1 chemotaxis receptor methyltransferase [Cupriavidus neocaledonicus]SPD59328.1 putative biofilm formation methyltransferase WspC [Cupriavidus neocaledonicus]SPD59353.1 putative biofilm formation methyltransferase WspC [Cupriavidus neocaledonicus]